jgi:hypothetical protein
MSDLIEAMAESLDEVLGEPASYELTRKIYAALEPHMKAALRETHHLIPKDQEPDAWLYAFASSAIKPYATAMRNPNLIRHGGTETPLYALEKRHD